MKRATALLAAGAILLTPACSMIVKETRHSGGYPGYLLDQRTFDASYSKKLQLLRATIILAMAADIGRTTVNGQDADGFAQLLAGAAKEINHAAADLYDASTTQKVCWTRDESQTPPIPNPVPTPTSADDRNCSGFFENFESNVPLIESRIVKVMLAALPTDKARKFLEDVTKGDVLGAAWKAVGAAGDIVGGLHVGFARYRSGLETVASTSTECKATNLQGTKERFRADTMTILQAASCLGLSEKDLFHNPNELKGMDLAQGTVNPRAFLMLMRGVAADCVALNFSGKGADLTTSQEIREKACNSIGFAPTARPYRFKSGSSPRDESAPTDQGSGPNPAPTHAGAVAPAAAAAPAAVPPAAAPPVPDATPTPGASPAPAEG